MIFACHQMLLCWSNWAKWDGRGVWHFWGKDKNTYRVSGRKTERKRPLENL